MFDKRTHRVFQRYLIAKVRSDKEKDQIYKRWKNLINMSPSELQDWARNPDRLRASISRQEAKKEHGGIHSGYDSLHRIKRRVLIKREEWDAEDYDNAAQENSFNSRMLGNDPGDPVPGTQRSKWEISLRNWGHDPRKPNSPGYSKFKAWKRKHFSRK